VYIFLLLDAVPATSSAIEDLPWFVLVLMIVVSSASLGGLSAYSVLKLRWWHPKKVADDRARQIDILLPHAVSLKYALSKGGVPYPLIMKTLAENYAVYGEVGKEYEVGVKDMEFFGTDMFTSLRRMSNHSPSSKFSEFLDSFLTVLESGRQVSRFLYDHYERYHEEAVEQQEVFLEQLGALAEAYVAILVAAPLLLLTILVVIGLVMQDTFLALQVTVYVGIPLATIAFIIYLETMFEYPEVSRENVPRSSPVRHISDIRRDRAMEESDRVNMERLTIYKRLEWLTRRLTSPGRMVMKNPPSMFYITLPLALMYLAFWIWRGAAAGDVALANLDQALVQSFVGVTEVEFLTVEYLDDGLIHAGIFVVGTFAIVQEVHRRRKHNMAAMIPVFLSEMASVNEAGRTPSESLEKVSESDLGVLTKDVKRTVADIAWGAQVENALYRFEDRLGTETFTRAVVLISNAMSALGSLMRVLRISADDARENFRMKVRRRETMLTYIIIVYISFFVFLAIIYVLSTLFIPNIPTGQLVPDTAGGTSVGGAGMGLGGGYTVTAADKLSYETALYHGAVVQAIFSGLVAGLMGEGSLRNGAKHVTVLMIAAYAMMLILG